MQLQTKLSAGPIYKLKPRLTLHGHEFNAHVKSYNRQWLTVRLERDLVNQAWTVGAWNMRHGRCISYQAFLPYSVALAHLDTLARLLLLAD